MKLLVIVVVLLAAGVVVLGFYQGWFHFSADSTDQKSSATITVDQDKFQKDEEKAKEKFQDFGHKVKEETK
jgi:predicted negative regulator of RcsB-dependent stress response